MANTLWHAKTERGAPTGVLIPTKDTINDREIDMNTNTEFTAASFECPWKNTLTIVALYRPPNGDIKQAYSEEMCSKIRSLYQSRPRSTIWIAGDANLRDIELDVNMINGHSNPNILNEYFL